jgi:hypothetical protein
MSDQANPSSAHAATSQRQRWIVYGGNVLLSCVVVVILAGLLIYLGQASNRRFDTTQSGLFSLKPQTLNVISNLSSPIKLVSLYSRKINRANQADYCQAVEDLLDEYKRNGRNIQVEFVDPLSDLNKKDDLITEVSQKYGGEVKRYRAFLDNYNQQYDQIKSLMDTDAKEAEALPLNQVKDDQTAVMLNNVINTVRGFGPSLAQMKDEIDQTLQQKLPDYLGAVNGIRDTMDQDSTLLAEIDQELAKMKARPDLPAPVGAYITAGSVRHAQLKKLADDLVAAAKGLGELKLDTLRQSLRDDSILVLGDNDLRVIGFDQVWAADDKAAKQAATETGTNQTFKPQFAGEQQITTAIFALTHAAKPRVVFVRPGGGPLTEAGILGLPQAGGGPFSEIAQRLGAYNFDVQEKDLSGSYATQAQMQGMPVPPEPSDADLNNAIWVVLAFPASQQPNGPPSPVGAKLAEHLKAGGSALVLPFQQEPSVVEPLHAWGIDIAPDALAVHELPPQTDVPETSELDRLRRVAYFFDIRDYGDHPITRPLQSLPSALFGILPVTMVQPAPADIAVTPIIPVPTVPPSWGSKSLDDPNNIPKFNPAADIPPPFFAGAAAEKKGAGRLVVLSAGQLATNQVLEYLDPEMAQHNKIVPAFPGNAELFMNSIFWLAHLEPMLAISPAAMQVSRVAPMSNGAQWLWRSLVLGGLPLVVLVVGLGVYFARRD